jgi:pimeloyl-ACP methyl ester carboxylesterase
MSERFSIQSTDGVEISVQKAGAGPALLLIHGALLNGTLSWGLVLPKLAEQFTVYALDRRGRAPSGDGKEYSLSREADDIVAVVRAIGQPVRVLAHSYGALATLEALDRLKGIEQLMLYEPPFTLAPPGPAAEARTASMERALEAGDRAQVVTIFLRDQIGVPEERLNALLTSPVWPLALQIASTLPGESRTVNTPRSWDDRLVNWNVPTTMLVGTESPTMLKETTAFIAGTIPGCQVVVLQGQGHSAMMDAPDLFVAKVLDVTRSLPSGLGAPR